MNWEYADALDLLLQPHSRVPRVGRFGQWIWNTALAPDPSRVNP